MANANEVGGHTLDTDLIFEMLKHHVFSLHPHKEKKKRGEGASTFFFWLGSDEHLM
jgi:hypothetical protein